ncbi:MAG: hypothetical protein Fur0034_11730 [Desulfuromonadia bacterium]
MRPYRVTIFLLWLATIWYLSLVSNLPLPETSFVGFDKLEHAGAYALLAFLAVLAFEPVLAGWRSVVLVIVILSVNGAILECLQKVMCQGRSFEVADMAANTVGTAVGAVVARRVTGHRERGR